MDSKKIKVAAVGAGYFSQFQYQGWRNMDDVKTVALANRSGGKGEALAAQYVVPKVYAHVEESLGAELPEDDPAANVSERRAGIDADRLLDLA